MNSSIQQLQQVSVPTAIFRWFSSVYYSPASGLKHYPSYNPIIYHLYYLVCRSTCVSHNIVYIH
jgi:hypothetical protein